MRWEVEFVLPYDYSSLAWRPTTRREKPVGSDVTETLYPLTIAAFMVAWVVGAWLVGVTAGNRGFKPVVWGLAALVISPLVGIVLLELVTPRTGPRPRS